MEIPRARYTNGRITFLAILTREPELPREAILWGLFCGKMRPIQDAALDRN